MYLLLKVLVRDMTEARKVANHKENFKEKAFAYEETKYVLTWKAYATI